MMDNWNQDVANATTEHTDERETDQITNKIQTGLTNNGDEKTDIHTFRPQKKDTNIDSDSEPDSSVPVVDKNDAFNSSADRPDDIPNLVVSDSSDETRSSNEQHNPSKDVTVHASGTEHDTDEDEEFTDPIRRCHKKKLINFSDSEDDSPNIVHEPTQEASDGEVEGGDDLLKNVKKSKYKRFVADSDSESELDVTPHNKSFTSESPCGDADLKTSNPKTATDTDKNGSRWSKLCDSESSEDEQLKNETKSSEVDELDEENIKPIKYKRKPQLRKKDEPKKMTRKDAQTLNKQIQSESQRMVREMNVSLPYHKPKQFTLKEFMSSRPKLAGVVPLDVKARPSVAIKLCSEKLEEISKNIEKREEKLKEFYKSESESDCNDSDTDYIPPTDDQNHDTPDIPESVEKSVESCIDTQESIIGTNSSVIPETPMDTNFDEKAVDSGIETQDMESEANEKSGTIVAHTPSKCSGIENNSETGTEELMINVEKDDQSNERSCIVSSTESTHVTINEMNGENIEDQEAVKSEDIADNTDQISAEKCIKTASSSCEIEVLANSNPEPIESMDYEFNLDDIEENTEPITSRENENPNNRGVSNIKILQNIVIEKEILPTKQIKFDSSELDVVIEDSSDETRSPPNQKDNVSTDEKEINSNLSELDIIENSSDKAVINVLVKKNSDKQRELELAQLDKEIENYNPYGSRNLEADSENRKTSKLKLLSEKLSNRQPRLSGNPDEVIDLDSGVTRPSEISKLMQRFIQHTTKKHVHKNKVKFNVVNIEGGEAHKETLAIHVDDDENIAIEERPGVRLHKLREELQKQIAARRSKLWQKKTTTEKTEETEKNPSDEEKSECGADEDALLDMEDEEEISESSEEEEEVEEDEKEKRKSAFVDGEAEESDGDDDECDNNGDEVVETSENEVDENDDEDENSKDSTETLEKEKTESGKRVLRRIVKGFTEDSDDDDEDETQPSGMTDNGDKNDEISETNTQISQDDEVLPCHQPQDPKTPVSHLKSRTKSDFEFLTPVHYLTGIQNLSASKNLKQSPTFSPFRMPTMPSPLKGEEWHSDLQKKLFAESEITNSQAQAMKDLCKTSFSSTQDEPDSTSTTVNTIPKSTEHDPQSEEIVCSAPPTSQDLLGICSGSFTGTSKICDDSTSNEGGTVGDITCSAQPTTQDLLNICSGAFTGVSQVDTTNLSDYSPAKARKEIKSLDPEQDIIISQLLDEEEMEKFKKKFDSPVYTNTQKRIVEDFEKEVTGGGVIDSDEDEEIEFKNRKRSKQKKIMFSDDEDSNDFNEADDEEKIDLQDDVEDDKEDDDDIPPENVEYDSEENEYEVVHDEKQVRTKASDFFEDEAELSESEWGSEDEDEKDLDAFEMEKGDEEKFDEKKLRSDLEKIHMRRLLDDDTREVKILQELLLEDGEMHGSGRERQFRWRNIDSQPEEGEERKDGEDDCYVEEDESEEQWRRKRYEREVFLQEQMRKKAAGDDDLLSGGSQLLKVGQKVVQIRTMRDSQGSQGSQGDTETEKAPGSPVLMKSSFTLSHTRGSFLNRKDQVLQRLAVFNKDTSVTVGSAKISVKHSKNFVFQSIAVEDEENAEKLPNKRKASDGTPNIIKKLRLSDNLSPADSRRQSKTPTSKVKLFANSTD